MVHGKIKTNNLDVTTTDYLKCMTAQKPEKFKLNVANTTYCVAKGDTGATNHYWKPQDKNILQNIKKAEELAIM